MAAQIYTSNAEDRIGLNIDYKNGFAHINELELLTDGAKIESTGSVNLADSIGVDLAVVFKEFDIKELLNMHR